MLEPKDISVIIATNLRNISEKIIEQLNNYSVNGINVLISIPPNLSLEKAYDLGFSEDINIIKSDLIGQVNQRQYAYKFCKTKLILQMDDDIEFDYSNVKKLLGQFINLPKSSCLAPFLNIKNKNEEKTLLINIIRFLRNIFLYSEINPKAGSIAKSSFPIPHNHNLYKNKSFGKVDWLPGGILLIKTSDIIKHNYFQFKGKAYSEDLIHSFLLNKSGIKLFLSSNISFKTPIYSYRDLEYKDFCKFIKNDLKIRNHFRKLMNKKLNPFLIAYLYICLTYFATKLKRYIFNLKGL